MAAPLPESRPWPGQETTPVLQPTVLVVDNDAPVRFVLGALLKAQGCRVLLASNAWESLKLYRQHLGDIDLVLLDVQLPGMDGLATLEALRDINPRVRCGFLSGGSTGDDDEANRLLRRGAELVIPKPYTLDHIGGLVRRLQDW
jgi:CheY-like chemotaxis protein